MAALTLLNDKINSITTVQEAKKLVKSWLPHHDLDRASFGLEAGVRNCSLIAEFVVVSVKAGVVNYASLLGSKPVTVRSPYKFPFTNNYRDVMVVESSPKTSEDFGLKMRSAEQGAIGAGHLRDLAGSEVVGRIVCSS